MLSNYDINDYIKENPDLQKRVIEQLLKEIVRLENGLKHYKRSMYKIISIATECQKGKQWNYKEVE